MTDSNESPQLEERLRQAEAAREGSYDKRTEHLNSDGSTIFINRLILEDSPYLLQHAHNPVNWFPWGAEAFALARQEHKPIFLSIGYSTCHWCHVMEVESFDNIEVARVLNRDFISIKLDREQYPDIDEIYMTGVQLISGQGGWPMSNFLLPNGRPFFAATYFPPPTFLRLLQQIGEAWSSKFGELENTARSIGEAIDRILGERKQAQALGEGLADLAAEALYQREDRSRGGLAGAPKFPQEPLLLFMLDRAGRGRDLNAYGFVARALQGMGRGGIYDQVAGGFHRYSVDADWLVPHFEKMLYNQSQLGLVYLEALRLGGDDFFRRILVQTLNYVLRDLQTPQGGFYSATDADSEGSEGTFFLWTPEQLQDALQPDDVALVTEIYGVTGHGNFEGATILSLPRSLADRVQEHGPNLLRELDRILAELYRVRERRIHPLRDDKLIVAWCGAMITTLARAADYFGQDDWLEAAARAAAVIMEHNMDGDGRLLRIYLNGTASIPGQLEDYVNFIEALLTLFDITGEAPYLERAVLLMDRVLELFGDAGDGAFYLGPDPGPEQGDVPRLTRSVSAADGATLSPPATALRCLALLRDRAMLTGKDQAGLYYGERLDRCSAALHAQVNEHPLSHTSLLRAIAGAREGFPEPIQYAGRGLARIALRRADPASAGSLLLTLEIADGWHVTAAAGESDYVPLQIALPEQERHWELAAVDYPAASAALPQADGSRVDVFSGTVHVTLNCRRSALPEDAMSHSVALLLTLQLCSEQECLLPETLRYRI